MKPRITHCIRRQAEPWQREASAHLAAGRVATALDAYDGAGGPHWSETRAAPRSACGAPSRSAGSMPRTSPPVFRFGDCLDA